MHVFVLDHLLKFSKIHLFLFYVYGCFACIYVCHHVFAGPTEPGRGCQVPCNWSWGMAESWDAHVDAGNQTQVLWKSGSCSWPSKSLQPLFLLFVCLFVFMLSYLSAFPSHFQHRHHSLHSVYELCLTVTKTTLGPQHSQLWDLC